MCILPEFDLSARVSPGRPNELDATGQTTLYIQQAGKAVRVTELTLQLPPDDPSELVLGAVARLSIAASHLEETGHTAEQHFLLYP